jgi:phosphate transport system permease protein
VVYGFFAALTVGPVFRAGFNALGAQLVGGPFNDLGLYLGQVQNQMALVAGAVMGIMLIPFVSSLSDDIINAVPQALRDGSYAMGATKSETIKRVILPAALPGVVAALLLAMSRAIGETMIVTLAAGLQAKLTANPLDTVTTVTVQIVTLLTGDTEFDNPKTLAAFGLGLTLFAITLVLNIIALRIVQKYREQYD